MTDHAQMARELYHRLCRRDQYPSDPFDERDARIEQIADALTLAYEAGQRTPIRQIGESQRGSGYKTRETRRGIRGPRLDDLPRHGTRQDRDTESARGGAGAAMTRTATPRIEQAVKTVRWLDDCTSREVVSLILAERARLKRGVRKLPRILGATTCGQLHESIRLDDILKLWEA